MSAKQPQLNGAYYGPSIPPPKTYHRPGRGRGFDCCCCGCLFDCICGCICQILLTIIFIIVVAGFVFWLVVRPNVLKFHVTDARLTQFNYSDDKLYYNLAVNITVRNPNRRLGVYYDTIEARALYQDARFDSDFLTPFYQGHKTTNVLSHDFQGEQLLALNADQTSELNKEKSAGIYDIDLKMYLKIRFKLGVFKIGKFKPKIKCDLKVPLTTNGTSSGVFETTKCDYSY